MWRRRHGGSRPDEHSAASGSPIGMVNAVARATATATSGQVPLISTLQKVRRGGEPTR
jgi:hypothetical protein